MNKLLLPLVLLCSVGCTTVYGNDVIKGTTLSVDGFVVETTGPNDNPIIIDNTTDKVQVIYYGNLWGQLFDPKPVPFLDPRQSRCKATWHNAGTVCNVN
jgi:hypothetical protein